MLGLAVAIMAYGLLDTVVEAWYASAQTASTTRLITRSTISLAYPLPLSHAQRIRAVEGVASVTWATWFGGEYANKRKPFAMFAVDGPSYFTLFPEFALSDADRLAFLNDRQGAIIGPKLASAYGFKVGDVIPIQGDVYPGHWGFTVRGIYQPKGEQTDDTMMLVHWKLLSETVRQRLGIPMDHVGLFVVSVKDPDQAAKVSQRIDEVFHNSSAETRTETERAYQLGIIAMSRNVLIAIRIVSVGLILIVMAVMTNTMTMSASERLSEFATLKAIGFSPLRVARLLLAESLTISVVGGLAGIALTYPASAVFVSAVGSLVKGFDVAPSTLFWQAFAALGVGLVAAAWPAWQMARLNVAQALRRVA